MSKRNKCMFIVLLAIIVLSMSQGYAATGATSVSVTLPTFNVALNGMIIDNQHSEYPFIVYKEITYFPMTYSACRFLGLESNWKGIQEGLWIESSDITAAYFSYRAEERNYTSFIATIPTFPIQINGSLIDNNTEEYPFLTYRDITYFPITWRFSVDEFGWDYEFDSEQGLSITSNNVHLLQSASLTDREEDRETMAIANGYAYYVGSNGQIMQSPLDLNQTPSSKVIYQLPINSYWGGTDYVLPNLFAKEGKAYLSYYSGGATMGTDHLFLLSNDGATLINNTRNTRVSFGNKDFQWWVGSAPSPGNLYMRTPETMNSDEPGYPGWKKIGDPDYLYGWNWQLNDATGVENHGAGGSGSSDCHLINDDLYILAFDTGAVDQYIENGGIKPTTGLYRVNTATNETTRISEQEVTGFKVEGDIIFYHNRYVELFKYVISEQKEYPITPTFARGNNFIEQFEVLGGHIYFESGVDHGLYNSDYETIGWGVQEFMLTGSNKEFVACTLSGNYELQDKILIFDQTGRVVFRTSDEAYALTVEGDKVYYFNKDTYTICIGDLSSVLKIS